MTMPPMTDLALTPEESREERGGLYPSMMEGDGPKYAYGLSISLDKITMSKLKIDVLPNIGDMIHGKFMAKVTRLSESANESGDECCIGLQLTHMALEDEDTETEEKTSRSKKLYDNEGSGDD